MKGTKEFYDLMAQFERDLIKLPVYTSAKPEREKTVNGHAYYTNGEINSLFIAYMAGYSFGKTQV